MVGTSGQCAAPTCCNAGAVTHSRPDIHELLDRHGLAARREFGQNFVADPNTVRRIAALAQVGSGDLVVEIGPGLGSLTLALIETGAEVVAIEVDSGMAAAAREVVGESARIIEGDALAVDWGDVVGSEHAEAHVVANLPYNVGTTIILDILEHVEQVKTLTVLVQAEVAERLAAGPGNKIYGIPSVLAALYADVEVVAQVPPTVFVPRPKVTSAVVRLVRRDQSVDVDSARLAQLVRSAFGQRRKMLRRSLNGLLDESQIASADVAPTARAEELDLAAWVRLASVTSPQS